ncbi:MAG: DUF1573 domain-containing protein [Phocaeicola sp.]|uniref:DUF1573 domain-containing protein n=1 Tax=Phocaeicola sp. TaxID=2773926 RepID=UPI0023BE43A9|nr:DUF1573 domain-containing protein [Phocaeicola sp.]MDE5677865.1 DUF1573 domain-containing protein [Phocaeicola sp.]MDE6180384.1 DUF1573 domain-containing protein [Phocaeicola sp.]
MRHFYLLLMLAFVSACHQESEKAQIARLVKEWDGKEILFPSRSVFTVQGRDTVDFAVSVPGYKVVSYVDSVGCTSCKLQLSRWKEFMQEVDSMVSAPVPFLFYFHPKDIRELGYITRSNAFAYPVCFDETDEFNRLNRFPADMTFQTFLLDSANRVVALGNPVHSPRVKELYLKVLTGNKAVQAETPMTEVRADMTEIDFGSFPCSERRERTFTLTNTGRNVLVIHDVVPSCGCTKVEYSQEGIRPGKQANLTVAYEAEKAEHFSKTITVYCNAVNSPLRVKVTGHAE